MVTLKNSDLAVKINELGAEVKSIYGFDTEYIWEGEKRNMGQQLSFALSYLRRSQRG